MKVVLAASIFPPDIGGPAHYAAELSAALQKAGHHVEVVVFGRYSHLPSGIRHIRYALHLMRRARHADVIIAFDVLTTGLPAAVVSFITGTPAVARVGGDFIWERYIERTGDLIPLPHFYAKRRWPLRERMLFGIVRFVLSRVHVAFSCEWIRDIWLSAYGMRPSGSSVIENAILPKDIAHSNLKSFFLYGRQLHLKNAPAFRRAIEAVRRTYPEATLDEGAVKRGEFIQRMRNSYVVAVPSISDVSPNTILDAIRFGKPFILTKYSGYAERFKDLGVIVDPLDSDDLERAIRSLLQPEIYSAYVQKSRAFDMVRSYDDIAADYCALLETHI